MKNTIYILLTVAAIVIGCGVAKDRQTADTWVGHPESELITAWGAPTSSTPNGEGKILVYDKSVRDVLSKKVVQVRSFQFFINKEGKVEKTLLIKN